MDRNKAALSSIALDLKRVAINYHHGSVSTANRFFEEAMKRKGEIDQRKLRPYLKEILTRLDKLTSSGDKEKIAEDALMYSVLFQNAAMVK